MTLHFGTGNNERHAANLVCLIVMKSANIFVLLINISLSNPYKNKRLLFYWVVIYKPIS